MHRPLLYFFVFILTMSACSVSKEGYHPQKKIAPDLLKEDLRVFRGVLEQYHPSIYWFTPKDSMDEQFARVARAIKDSMTEMEFRNRLQYVLSEIQCGHTAVLFSKNYVRYLDTALLPVFPLSFKVWPDSMAVTSLIGRPHPLLKRGTIVYAVNGQSTRQLTDTLFHYLVTDGNALIGKYQTLSTRGNFGTLYRSVFGMPEKISLEISDSTGQRQTIQVKPYQPVKDTSSRKDTAKRRPAPAPRPMVNPIRNLQIDTTLSSAYMTLNSFASGNKLRSFFRESFKTLRENQIKHLVIDVRSNGGGNAGLSTLLTRYLIDTTFKLADTLYAVTRNGDYNKYIKRYWLIRLALPFITRKRADGHYHFRYFERHYYKPRRHNHFNGEVYILTGGNSFSATTLFAKALKGQKNVTILGEETGGGSYGNTAWMIPDVKLPNTHIRFRLPLFRLVMDKEAVAAGRGVMPDIEVVPTGEDVRKGVDAKLQAVRRLIISKSR